MENVEARLNRNNLIRRIAILVERRHKIVHSGDLNALSRPNRLDPRDTVHRIQELGTLVFEAESYLVDKIGI